MKQREQVSVEELLFSQIHTFHALVNVLEEKGLISRNEILDKLEELKQDSN